MSINVTVDVSNVGEVVRNLGNIEKEMKKKFPERVRKTMIWNSRAMVKITLSQT